MSEPKSIGRRISVLVTAALSLLLVLLLSSLFMTFQMNAQVSTLTGNVIPSLDVINGVAVKFASIRATTLRYMLARDEADRAELAKKLVFFRQGMERDLTRYESDFVVDPRERILLRQIRQAMQAFDAHQYDVLAVSASEGDPQVALEEAQASLGQVSDALRQHHDYSLRLTADAVAAARHNVRLGLLAMLVLSSLAGIGLLMYGSRTRGAIHALTARFREGIANLRDQATQVSAAAADLLLVSRRLSEVADRQSVQAEHMDAAADDLEVGIPGVLDRLTEAQEQVVRTAVTLSRMREALDRLAQQAGPARPGLPDALLAQALALFEELESDVGRSGAVMVAVNGAVEAQFRNTLLLVQQSGKVARLALENTSIAANASASAMSLSTAARAMNDEIGRCAA